MPFHFRKTIAIAVVTGALGLSLAPAMAADWDDAGYGWGHQGSGYGNWRRGGWNRGGWDNGGWDNGGAAAAALGGFALGAAAGAAYQPRYGGCYVVDRPIRDYWGNVVDYRSVQVCE